MENEETPSLAPHFPAPVTPELEKRRTRNREVRKAGRATAKEKKKTKGPANHKGMSNLRPPVLGEVRNPYGRWGKAGRKNNLKAILDSILFEDGEVSTKAEKIMNVLTRQAEQGNMKAIEIILDRIDGKVADKVQLEATDPLACIVLPAKKVSEDA